MRQKLVEETQQIKRSEDAAKSRMMKKYSKQVQVQKLQDRAKAKTAALDKIKLLRKGKKNIGNDGGDDFDVSVDDTLDEKPKPAGGKKKKEEGGNKGDKEGRGSRESAPQRRGKSQKRLRKDEKFGHGGKKRHSKSNTAESTDYFGGGVKKTRSGLPPKVALFVSLPVSFLMSSSMSFSLTFFSSFELTSFSFSFFLFRVS